VSVYVFNYILNKKIILKNTKLLNPIIHHDQGNEFDKLMKVSKFDRVHDSSLEFDGLIFLVEFIFQFYRLTFS
jgi:hypothetical protein